MTKYYFVYTDHKIIQFFGEDDQTEHGILNVKNCRLKRYECKDSTGKRMYGFILMAKRDKIEFYCDRKDVRDKWISALKSSVILLDLKDEFVVTEQLGQGNFAKVHLCSKRDKPD